MKPFMCTMNNNNLKDSENFHNSSWTIAKLMTSFFLLISISYLFYSLGFITHSYDCPQKKPYPFPTTTHFSNKTAPPPSQHTNKTTTFEEKKTIISHIVFGIASSSRLWNHRKEYIKLWWRPNETRGNVWLDQEVKSEPSEEHLLPTLRISSDVSKFKVKNPQGDRLGVRISRIVSETVRLGMEKNNNNVRWFVMGDDDTFFVTENLVKVLQKYDHNQFYYIGTNSESHLQNIHFSYNMAYGGGGFAISYPLAATTEQELEVSFSHSELSFTRSLCFCLKISPAVLSSLLVLKAKCSGTRALMYCSTWQNQGINNMSVHICCIVVYVTSN